MENFGKFMALVLTMIISPVINGFVLMKLWIWFVAPILETSPLRLVEAVGLMFLFNYIKARRDKEVDEEKFSEKLLFNMIYLVLISGLTLLSGWIVQGFM